MYSATIANEEKFHQPPREFYKDAACVILSIYSGGGHFVQLLPTVTWQNNTTATGTKSGTCIVNVYYIGCK